LPAVTGGLFELLVVVLHVAATVDGAMDFGEVGVSLHAATATTITIRLPASLM
jgi:hypothetical protein